MEITEAELLNFRLSYQAAYDAYETCAKALSDLDLRGERPSAELLEEEAKALKELSEARERYRDALMQIAFDTTAPQ